MRHRELGLFACLIVTCWFRCTTARAQDARPEVEVSLIRSTVYVGEMPELRLTMSAPAAREVQVLPLSLVNQRGALRVKLKATRTGQAISSFVSDWGPKPGDFNTLQAGKSMSSLFELGVRPQEPGHYLAHIEFQPSPDGRFLVRQTLELNVVPIDPADIVSTMKADVRMGVQGKKPSDLDGTVQVHKLRTGKTYKLAYQFNSSQSPADPEVVTALLWEVDESAKVLDIAISGIQLNPLSREVWIIFDSGGIRHLGRIQHGSGRILQLVKFDATAEPTTPKS